MSGLLEVMLGQMWHDLNGGRGYGEVIEIDLEKKRARLLFQRISGPKAWVALSRLQNGRDWALVPAAQQ